MNPDELVTTEQKQRIGAAFFLEAGPPFSEMDEEVDDDVLIRYADGTLRGKERKAIAAACRTNVATAMIVADFVQEYAEIRHLAWDCMGWKGAVQFARGKLSQETAHAWKQHLDRDPSSRKKTDTAIWWLGVSEPKPSQMRVLRLATNTMVLLLVFGIGHEVKIHSSNTVQMGVKPLLVRPPVDQPHVAPIGDVQSKGLGVGGGNDLSGPEDIEQRTQANDTNDLEELGYRVQYLEAVRDNYPQVTAYQELLLPMYRKCAALEHDPAQKQAWNRKAQAALLFIQTHSHIIQK